jgi:hypothetical protein
MSQVVQQTKRTLSSAYQRIAAEEKELKSKVLDKRCLAPFQKRDWSRPQDAPFSQSKKALPPKQKTRPRSATPTTAKVQPLNLEKSKNSRKTSQTENDGQLMPAESIVLLLETTHNCTYLAHSPFATPRDEQYAWEGSQSMGGSDHPSPTHHFVPNMSFPATFELPKALQALENEVQRLSGGSARGTDGAGGRSSSQPDGAGGEGAVGGGASKSKRSTSPWRFAEVVRETQLYVNDRRAHRVKVPTTPR